jgi:N6-L-threonylcarbamoyladenine synthase
LCFQEVQFPFLVLLISGGHSLLAIAESVDSFVLLGETADDAPGEAFDKVARRLKLKDHPKCAGMSGGRAIQAMAREGNPRAFVFPFQMAKYRDCMFSFSGLKDFAYRLIDKLEKEHGECFQSFVNLFFPLSHISTLQLLNTVRWLNDQK